MIDLKITINGDICESHIKGELATMQEFALLVLEFERIKYRYFNTFDNDQNGGVTIRKTGKK